MTALNAQTASPALPEAFAERMRLQLGDEAEAFLSSYAEPRTKGLRLHPLKLRAEDPLFADLREAFSLRPVPWCETGYFYDEAARPGRHPWHAAGLYYIQEPSAMIAAELLGAEPGDVVLDLAAAPGGKTTQLAAKLAGRGLLVANEIHAGRAKILAENVERLGIANAVVTSAPPDALSTRWPEAFDKIMLDAPCSGEGMFRKDPEAANEWTPEAVEACARRQRSILPDAAKLLKPGGRLVYSTCTFNREENEETIAWFLETHPSFRLSREERMWPHRGEGEGHYAAVLEKSGHDGSANGGYPSPASFSAANRVSRSRRGAGDASAAVALGQFREFAAEALPGYSLPAEGEPLLFGEALYWLPKPAGSPLTADSMRGLKLPRPGLHLGDVRKGRFEPAHALAMAVPASSAARVVDYPPGSPETAAYLRGESLAAAEDAPRGWGLMTADGHPLGWFKTSEGQHKNRLPKGLRQSGA